MKWDSIHILFFSMISSRYKRNSLFFHYLGLIWLCQAIHFFLPPIWILRPGNGCEFLLSSGKAASCESLHWNTVIILSLQILNAHYPHYQNQATVSYGNLIADVVPMLLIVKEHSDFRWFNKWGLVPVMEEREQTMFNMLRTSWYIEDIFLS